MTVNEQDDIDTPMTDCPVCGQRHDCRDVAREIALRDFMREAPEMARNMNAALNEVGRAFAAFVTK